MTIADWQLEAIVNALIGSCSTLDEILDWYKLVIDDLSKDDLEYIDERIFCCEICGWWTEYGDFADSEVLEFHGMDNICSDHSLED